MGARKPIEPPAGLVYLAAPPRRGAFDWPPSERAWLAARLEKLGSSIRELSDMREELGRERLSWATPLVRRVSPALLLGRVGKLAQQSVRRERAELAVVLARCSDEASRWSRKRFGVGSQVDSWRLSELRLVAWQATLFDRARAAERAQRAA